MNFLYVPIDFPFKACIEIGFPGFIEVFRRIDQAVVFKCFQLSHEIIFAEIAVDDAFFPFVGQIDPFIAEPNDPAKIAETYCLSAIRTELPCGRHRVLAIRAYGHIPGCS